MEEIIVYYHLKNLEEISDYTLLNTEDIFKIIEGEIETYLNSIIKGKIKEELNRWKQNLKNTDVSILFQLLLNRKLVLGEYIHEYTSKITDAIEIYRQIEQLSSYQENLFIQYKKGNISVQENNKNILKSRMTEMHKILECIPAHINIYDLETDKAVYNNGAGKKLFGHDKETVMNAKFSKLWLSIVHPSDKEKIKKRIQNFNKLKDGEVEHLEYRLISKNNETVWYHSRATVFKRVNGKVRQVLLNGINITVLKEIEKANEYVKGQLDEAQKIAHIGNYDWDMENDSVIYTKEVYRMYHLPRDKKHFDKADFISILKKEDINKFEETLDKALYGESNEKFESEYRIVLPNKTEKDIVSRAQIIRNEYGKPIRMYGTVMDITNFKQAEYSLREKNKEIIKVNEELERSQMEVSKINSELEERIKVRTKELKDSEERYRFIAENLPHLFWTSQPKGGIDFQNKNIYDYTGASPGDLKDWNWRNFIHPDDLERVETKWENAIKTESTLQLEFRIKRADGEYRWHLGKTVPLKDEDGNIIKWMGSATDIDFQKKYSEELKAKNKLLTKTNQDLDNFVYTASHDLKAPISNIEGLINALSAQMSEGCKSEGDNLDILKMVNSSVQMFKHTILGLTEITHAQKSGNESIEDNNLNELVEEVEEMLKDQIKITDADITKNFNDCETIKFSRKNLKSILFNLLSNAIKFHSPDRVPKIEIKTQCLDNYIEISIKDNGLGFDPKQKAKAFEMFRKLHSHTEGSGVGLYLVKRIITNAGGKINVESEKGKGAEFKLYFKV